MAEPVVTSGWFEIDADGNLIRHQLEPAPEVTRIGEDFIFQRRDSRDGGIENEIFPIPSALAPFLSSLRSIVHRTGRKTLTAYPHKLESDSSGWKLSLDTGSAETRNNPIVLEGCGNVLLSVELQLRNRERRRIVFTKIP